MTTIALPVVPHPLKPDQLAALKQAKAELDLDYLIKPVPAVPLPPRPILAFEAPSVIGEYALIRPGWSVQNVKAALRAVLEEPEHPAIATVAHQLSRILGREVKELKGEDDASDERVGGDSKDQPGVAFR